MFIDTEWVTVPFPETGKIKMVHLEAEERRSLVSGRLNLDASETSKWRGGDVK